MTPAKFNHDQPRCHGNTIWDKIGYNSACIRDISWMVALDFGVGVSNDVNQILQRPTLVAMATKIETKQAMTPPV